MRIIHVIRSDGWAGVERHVAELARAQAGQGDHVTVIGGDPGPMRRVLGPEIRHLPAVRVANVAIALHRVPAGADVVNTHMTAADLGAAVSWRHRSAALVSTRHFSAPRGASMHSRPALRLLDRRLAGQIAVSRYVAERIDGPSTVVLSGVPSVDGLVPARSRTATILAAQRLEAEKGCELALEAFARSGLAASGWSLDVAGDGALKPKLQDLAHDLGVQETVRFLGYRDDVHDLMCDASIFIATGQHEAFGLSVVEAMARGLPVVAAGGGAYLETVGSLPAPSLFEPGDVRDAARHLSVLAGDAALRDRYGRRLQEAQRQHFTVDLQARRTAVAYQEFM